MARIPLTPETAAEALFLSDRTCCVCREKSRKVEIHHLDEDATNNALSNLVVLCKDCHSEAHTRHAFARNLTPTLLRMYNDSWREIVKSRGASSMVLTGETQYQSQLLLELQQERIARRALEVKLAPRRLSKSHTAALTEALTPYKGQKCVISYAFGDTESDTYANDFVKVLDAAKWDHNGDHGILGSVWKSPIVGIEITVPPGLDPTSGMVTPGVGALIQTLRKLGLTTGPYDFYTDPSIPTYTADIRIGTK